MVNTILSIAMGIMLLSIILSLVRFVKGPCYTDRIIAFDVMTISSLAIIAGIAGLNNRVIYLDIAMVYGILSFLGVLIVARYLEKGL
ncbi:MAG: monovalent cation/H+ antiporter complex subunit F [Bacteroidales bacterium]